MIGFFYIDTYVESNYCNLRRILAQMLCDVRRVQRRTGIGDVSGTSSGARSAVGSPDNRALARRLRSFHVLNSRNSLGTRRLLIEIPSL